MNPVLKLMGLAAACIGTFYLVIWMLALLPHGLWTIIPIFLFQVYLAGRWVGWRWRYLRERKELAKDLRDFTSGGVETREGDRP